MAPQYLNRRASRAHVKSLRLYLFGGLICGYKWTGTADQVEFRLSVLRDRTAQPSVSAVR